jgi:cytoplasmic iron level regulating protein YaaA (DUF328/UPF0246 family)
MLITLSPAKTLDFDKQTLTRKHTTPIFLDDSSELVDCLREYSPRRLATLMGMSDKLAALNHERFSTWSGPFTTTNAKQAVLTFRGLAYEGLDADSYSATDFTTAQKSLRILSGLHGILRPLDLIQPYRLEMGTKLKSSRGKDLYEFWDTKITGVINKDLGKSKDPVLVNLASVEYFKSIQPEMVQGRIVTPTFKEKKNGTFKQVTFFAKKARGLMTSYIIQNQLEDVEDLKAFDLEGYRFNMALSEEDDWVFTRTSG